MLRFIIKRLTSLHKFKYCGASGYEQAICPNYYEDYRNKKSGYQGNGIFRNNGHIVSHPQKNNACNSRDPSCFRFPFPFQSAAKQFHRTGHVDSGHIYGQYYQEETAIENNSNRRRIPGKVKSPLHFCPDHAQEKKINAL